jgi:MFS family permease
MVTAVMLAWLANVAGAVAPKIMAEYGMSFRYYVAVTLASVGVGAVTAVAAGMSDRFGRVRIVVVGLVAVSLLALFVLPGAGNKQTYLGFTMIAGLVEGAVGVALPALVRDFSPQTRRATAMALWTIGPVGGSLIVTGVARWTLDEHPGWRLQFRIAGGAGLVVAVLVALCLRELAPAVRNQLLVRGRDAELVQLRARAGLVSSRPGWRSVLRPDIVGSAFAMSVYLIFYYAVVGFLVVYLTTNFGYSGSKANGVATAYWAASAVSLVLAGVISDRLRVRKPLLVIGAVIGVVGSVLMAVCSTRPHVGHDTLIAVLVLAAVGNALVFAPWLAAYSETVERHNPAAVAAGLATWSAVTKVVVTVVLVGFTFVVSAPSALVDHGAQVGVIAARHPAAVHALATGQPIPPTDQLSRADAAYLRAHLADVRTAQQHGPREWQKWWWVCALAELAFIPCVGLLSGRWRPRRAAADQAAHDLGVAAELAELRAQAVATV